jgi:hypothetical protein
VLANERLTVHTLIPALIDEFVQLIAVTHRQLAAGAVDAPFSALAMRAAIAAHADVTAPTPFIALLVYFVFRFNERAVGGHDVDARTRRRSAGNWTRNDDDDDDDDDDNSGDGDASRRTHDTFADDAAAPVVPYDDSLISILPGVCACVHTV